MIDEALFMLCCLEVEKENIVSAREFTRRVMEKYLTPLTDECVWVMEHRPTFCIYRDGDKFFAALPEFVNLQESEVVWLEQIGIRTLYQKLRDINHLGRKRTVETVDRWGQKTIQEKES